MSCSREKRALQGRASRGRRFGKPQLTLNVRTGTCAVSRGVPLTVVAGLAIVPIIALSWEIVAVGDVVRRHTVPATTMQFGFCQRHREDDVNSHQNDSERTHTQQRTQSGRLSECHARRSEDAGRAKERTCVRVALTSVPRRCPFSAR